MIQESRFKCDFFDNELHSVKELIKKSDSFVEDLKELEGEEPLEKKVRYFTKRPKVLSEIKDLEIQKELNSLSDDPIAQLQFLAVKSIAWQKQVDEFQKVMGVNHPLAKKLAKITRKAAETALKGIYPEPKEIRDPSSERYYRVLLHGGCKADHLTSEISIIELHRSILGGFKRYHLGFCFNDTKKVAYLRFLRHPGGSNWDSLAEIDLHLELIKKGVRFIVPIKAAGDEHLVLKNYDRDFESICLEGGFLDQELDHVIFCLASGLSDIHAAGVAHLDFKCANILISSETEESPVEYAIADFGSARKVKEKGKRVQPPHTSGEVLAPESWITGDWGYASDIYAFGAMLYQTQNGQLPGLNERKWYDFKWFISYIETACLRYDRVLSSKEKHQIALLLEKSGSVFFRDLTHLAEETAKILGFKIASSLFTYGIEWKMYLEWRQSQTEKELLCDFVSDIPFKKVTEALNGSRKGKGEYDLEKFFGIIFGIGSIRQKQYLTLFRCMLPDPSKRPSAEEIVALFTKKDPFFSEEKKETSLTEDIKEWFENSGQLLAFSYR